MVYSDKKKSCLQASLFFPGILFVAALLFIANKISFHFFAVDPISYSLLITLIMLFAVDKIVQYVYPPLYRFIHFSGFIHLSDFLMHIDFDTKNEQHNDTFLFNKSFIQAYWCLCKLNACPSNESSSVRFCLQSGLLFNKFHPKDPCLWGFLQEIALTAETVQAIIVMSGIYERLSQLPSGEKLSEQAQHFVLSYTQNWLFFCPDVFTNTIVESLFPGLYNQVHTICAIETEFPRKIELAHKVLYRYSNKNMIESLKETGSCATLPDTVF